MGFGGAKRDRAPLVVERLRSAGPAAVGGREPAVAVVDDDGRRELAVRVPSTASSVFIDSALPGRNDVVSFFSASVNLPGMPPTIATTSTKIIATTNFGAGPRGRRDPCTRGF